VGETTGNFEVGFGRPPRHSQFVKGKSGNPKGRPKGSQNLATIFEKVGRERITVTENGRSRTLTKKHAAVLQLTNKSVSGDTKALRDYLHLTQTYEAAQQNGTPVSDERDTAVMESILKRIRLTDTAGSEPQTKTEQKKSEEED
jgi:predicted ATPase